MPAATGDEVRIFAYPANSAADELALQMLKQMLDDLPVALDVCESSLDCAPK